MDFMTPLLFTLAIILFISYTTITKIIVLDQSWFITGIVHVCLTILTIWSLFATNMTDPGYVSTQYQYEKQEDLEKVNEGNLLSEYSEKYILINASEPLIKKLVDVHHYREDEREMQVTDHPKVI